MDLAISVNFQEKNIIVMAIPYYVPDGIGPVDVNHNRHSRVRRAQQQQPVAGNLPNNPQPDHNNYYTNPAALQTVNPIRLRDRPNQPLDIFSFPHQLIQELYVLYQYYIVTPQLNSSRRSPPNLDEMELLPRVNYDDNQGRIPMRMGQEVAVSSGGHTSYPMPDIIECHRGVSMDVTYQGCVVGEGRRGGEAHNHPHNFHHHGPRRIPSNNNIGNNNNHDLDGLFGPEDDLVGGGREEDLLLRAGPFQIGGADWTLQVKLLVGPWQQTGLELRAIADNFALEFATEQNPSQRSQRLKCRIVLKMGLPSLAMAGLGLYCWLRLR